MKIKRDRERKPSASFYSYFIPKKFGSHSARVEFAAIASTKSVNCSGLKKPLSQEEIEKRKGNPELWKEFLIEGATPNDLRKAWDLDPYSVEEILEEVSSLFGMSWAGIGFYDYEYVLEEEPSLKVTSLYFQGR